LIKEVPWTLAIHSSQHNARFVVLYVRPSIEPALDQAGTESSVLNEFIYDARFETPEMAMTRKQPSVKVGPNDAVIVLEQDIDGAPVGKGQHAERPGIRLAEVSQSEEPHLAWNVVEGRVYAGPVERIPR
jgi:hypothetical protein